MPHADFDVLFLRPTPFTGNYSGEFRILVRLTPDDVRLYKALATACARAAENHDQVMRKIQVRAEHAVLVVPVSEACRREPHIRRVTTEVTWPKMPSGQPGSPVFASLNEVGVLWSRGHLASPLVSYTHLERFLYRATLGLGCGSRIGKSEWAALTAPNRHPHTS